MGAVREISREDLSAADGQAEQQLPGRQMVQVSKSGEQRAALVGQLGASASTGKVGGGSSGGGKDNKDKEVNSAKVLIIYVGGTMGMTEDEHGSLRPTKGYLTMQMRNLPGMATLEMPQVDIIEYDNLVDSSDMDWTDWAAIAKDIEKAYYQYDGFVLIQGTDTMAYTASALSFMLENLAKPVIVTGSMIPWSKGYSDARRNLLISLDIAGSSAIPEVCIFFHDKLMRGNRCKKLSTEALDAFYSPNHPPLANVGVSIVYHEMLFRVPPRKRFRAHTDMDTGIVATRLIPGFDDNIFHALAALSRDSLKAVVVETYGTGNAPSRRAGLINALKEIVDSGKLVVVVSQCPTGHVDLKAYAVGRKLDEIGCVSGEDMTLEAVATKLSYLFGKGLTPAQVTAMLSQDLRGELTPGQRKLTSMI
jgi:L-asparaginase